MTPLARCDFSSCCHGLCRKVVCVPESIAVSELESQQCQVLNLPPVEGLFENWQAMLLASETRTFRTRVASLSKSSFPISSSLHTSASCGGPPCVQATSNAMLLGQLATTEVDTLNAALHVLRQRSEHRCEECDFAQMTTVSWINTCPDNMRCETLARM